MRDHLRAAGRAWQWTLLIRMGRELAFSVPGGVRGRTPTVLAHLPKAPRLAIFPCKVSSPRGCTLPPLRKRFGGADDPPGRLPQGAQRQRALRDLRCALAAPTAQSRFLEASDNEGTPLRPPQAPWLRSCGRLVPREALQRVPIGVSLVEGRRGSHPHGSARFGASPALPTIQRLVKTHRLTAGPWKRLEV